MKNNLVKTTVIGSHGDKYTISKSKNSKKWDMCNCERWINTSPRENCKHIKAALAGKHAVAPAIKKEKTMPKAKPLNGELKAAVPAVLATVKTNSKPGFWTREKLAEKLAEKFGKRTVVSAIVYLRTGANRKLDKKRGGYLLAKASA